VHNLPLTPKSLIFATVQQTSGSAMVKAAVPNVGASSFTIYLDKAVSVSVKVAWFVIN